LLAFGFQSGGSPHALSTLAMYRSPTLTRPASAPLDDRRRVYHHDERLAAISARMI
jgi:hypothetical protein